MCDSSWNPTHLFRLIRLDPGPPDSPFPFRRHRYAGALQADPPDIPLAGMASFFAEGRSSKNLYEHLALTLIRCKLCKKHETHENSTPIVDAQAISPVAHETTHDLRASDSNPLAHSDFTKSSSWIAGIATSFYESGKPLFTKHMIVFIEVLGRDWKSLVFGA